MTDLLPIIWRRHIDGMEIWSRQSRTISMLLRIIRIQNVHGLHRIM